MFAALEFGLGLELGLDRMASTGWRRGNIGKPGGNSSCRNSIKMASLEISQNGPLGVL